MSLGKLNAFSALLLSASVLFCLTLFIEGLQWANVIYFVIGSFMQRMDFKFKQFVVPSLVAIVPVALVTVFGTNVGGGDPVWCGIDSLHDKFADGHIRLYAAGNQATVYVCG